MADTTLLKSKIEPYVRDWLADKFGQPFLSAFLPLSRVKGNPGKHEFDAVSEDRKIICGIKTASWKTKGGKRGSGKIQGAYAELYFLDHVKAGQKHLVLTDLEFFENLTRNTQGKLPPNIGLLYCPLPDHLERVVATIRTRSRNELTKK